MAHTATDLEAARAITYAAADLKTEFDRRPRNEHLAREANTLVCEALHFAEGAVRRMTDRVQPIRASDPSLASVDVPRHGTSGILGCSDEATSTLESEIGEYYEG